MPQPSNASRPAGITNGTRIPEFKPGREGPRLSSAGDMNLLVKTCNAFLNLEVHIGYGYDNKLLISESKSILILSPRALLQAAGVVQRFKVKSIAGDFLLCRAWDGTQEGAFDVRVAKPFKLRNSIATETLIGGIVVNYDYVNSIHRTAHGDNGETEEQYVTPDYLTNDLILAVQGETGLEESGEKIQWTDLNIDARAWATF